MKLYTLKGLRLEDDNQQIIPFSRIKALLLLAHMTIAGRELYRTEEIDDLLFSRKNEEKGKISTAGTYIREIRTRVSNDLIITTTKGKDGYKGYKLKEGILKVDALDFRSALGKGEWDEAKKEYAGKFLSHQEKEIEDCRKEFRDWVEEQRILLEKQRECIDLLDAAQKDGCNGNFSEASEESAEAYQKGGEEIGEEGLRLAHMLLTIEGNDIAKEVKKAAQKKHGTTLSINSDRDVAKEEFRERYKCPQSNKNANSQVDKRKFHQEPHPAIPIKLLPYGRNKDFTGRTEFLKHLKAFLHKDKTVVLCGMGGVGKTQIALQYLFEHENDYQLIHWLRARDEDILRKDYKRFSKALNPSDKWLLIFDNASSPDIIYPYVFPNKDGGHILITSRYQEWKGTATPIQVDVWQRIESLEFLEKCLKLSSKEKSIANELAHELGDLPLALAQAVAYIESNANEDIDLESYIGLFRNQREELWRNEEAPIHYREEGKNGKRYTIATTWKLAIKKVGEVTGARELLALCSFWAPDDIPFSLIKKYHKYLPKLLSDTLANQVTSNAAIKALRNYSLITKTKDNIFIHRLIQTVTRDLLEEAKREEWTDITIKILNEALLYDQGEVDTQQALRRLIPHTEYVTTQVDQEAETGETIDLANNLYHIALLHYKQLEYKEAESLCRRVLEVRERLLGTRHLAVASSLHLLAVLLRVQAKSFKEAEISFRRALEIKMARLGLEHSDVAQTLNSLAVLLQQQRRYKEAEQLCRKGWVISKRVLGEKHPEALHKLNNLAQLLGQNKRYDEAEASFRKVLALREEILEEDHPDIAKTMHDFSWLFYIKGEYEEAEGLCRNSLAIREKKLINYHPDIGESLKMLAVLLHTKKEHQEAIILYNKALYIFEKVYGEVHPVISETMTSLARLFQEQGKLKNAESLLQRALAIDEEVFGKKHSRTLEAQKYLDELLHPSHFGARIPIIKIGISLKELKKKNVQQKKQWFHSVFPKFFKKK